MDTPSTPAMVRLRKAGVGVVAGGVTLVALSLVADLWLVALVLLAGSIVGGVLLIIQDRSAQVFLGVGAVGAIGLLEVLPGVGLGLSAVELGGLAIVFGLFDIVGGTLVNRLQPSPDD